MTIYNKASKELQDKGIKIEELESEIVNLNNSNLDLFNHSNILKQEKSIIERDN